MYVTVKIHYFPDLTAASFYYENKKDVEPVMQENAFGGGAKLVFFFRVKLKENLFLF